MLGAAQQYHADCAQPAGLVCIFLQGTGLLHNWVRNLQETLEETLSLPFESHSSLLPFSVSLDRWPEESLLRTSS